MVVAYELRAKAFEPNHIILPEVSRILANGQFLDANGEVRQHIREILAALDMTSGTSAPAIDFVPRNLRSRSSMNSQFGRETNYGSSNVRCENIFESVQPVK